jgi:hypothetical protein
VTDFAVTAENVATIAGLGRSRWKIENEQFNVHKNQGYELEHHYGHGQQHLATVRVWLMLLAFLVDQIQQRGSQGFRQVWCGLKTKAKLWDTLRSLFRVLVFESNGGSVSADGVALPPATGVASKFQTEHCCFLTTICCNDGIYLILPAFGSLLFFACLLTNPRTHSSR